MTAQEKTPLSQEIASLASPEQIHPVKTISISLLLLCSGVFFLLSSVLFVVIYLKVPFKPNDAIPPETMLYIAAGVALLGLLQCTGAWLKGDLGKPADEAYLIYPDELVILQNESLIHIRWDDVTELHSPRNLGDYKIVTRDGRTFPIKHAAKDYSSLIHSVLERVKAAMIPPLYGAVEAGQTVTFGPFEVNRDSIGYKGKVLAWDNVAVLQIVSGGMGRRLRIRACGSPLPWCYCSLESFPNAVLFPELLRVLCPQRLLSPASR